LKPEHVAAVLADFQAWLGALPASPDGPPPDDDAGPDLYTLLEQLTALRHEINLQTKATRSQQEQNAATLDQLTRALQQLSQTSAAAPENGEQARPLLKTLVELYDALAVAGREAQRVQEHVLPVLRMVVTDADGVPPEPQAPATVPTWARWLGVRQTDLSEYRAAVADWRKREEVRAEQRRKGIELVKTLLGSLTAGYAMSLQRVERALKQHGLETIPAAGRPFDPERMEAVEAVVDSGHPSGYVIDEVQRGYLWNGRMFRFAKVRVAKS
jgi:molecular chaperone GrpE